MADLLPILEDYRNRSAAAIDSIPLEQVAALISDLVAVRESGGRVFCIGNGGSQANVQHLVLHLREHGIFAIDLLADNAAVTALANDKGYAYVASNSLLKFHRFASDMVLAISGSGTSPNVQMAASNSMSWLITANLQHPSGTAMMKSLDGISTVRILTLPVSDYGQFEDASAAVLHMIERGLRSLRP